MVTKPTLGALGWGETLNDALDDVDVTNASSAARAHVSGTYGVALRDLLVPITTRAAPVFDSPTGLATAGHVGTGRLSHVVTRTGYGIVLAFSNFYPVSAAETDTPNPITVAAAFEPVSGQPMPVTFNGQRTTTISPGGTVFSDPVGIDAVKGSTVWTRTFVQVGGTEQFPRGGFIASGASEGNNYGATGTDLTAVSSSAGLAGTNQGTRVFGPSAILAHTTTPDRAVVAVVGDSIASGSGDNDKGWIERALAGNYSFQKVAYPSEGYFGFLTGNGDKRRRRMGLLARVGVTHVVSEYGVNSLGTTTVQTDAVTAWTALSRIGVPVYATTLTPQTSSTDSWATVENQTLIYPTDREPRRLAYNAWLRDGAPISGGAPVAVDAAGIRAGESGHPLTGWLEVADLAESARDSGKWKVGYTSDGTHPNATGAAALAAALDPSIFGAIST